MIATNGRQTAPVVMQDEEGVALRWTNKGVVFGVPFNYTTFYTWAELRRHGFRLEA